MKKKLFVLASLFVAISLALAGCGTPAEPQVIEKTVEVQVTQVVQVTAVPDAAAEEGGEIADETTVVPDIGISEVFEEGDLVEIYGTEGQGLSLRDAPGLSSVVGEYGLESEVFEIHGGPIDADGYTWWYLVNPYDNTKQGWGVGRFLRKISP